jgi:hypothetical protein
LLLEEEILRITARTPSEPQSFAVTMARVQEGEKEIPHVRVGVGQTWEAERRCRILDSAREFPIETHRSPSTTYRTTLVLTCRTDPADRNRLS